MSPRRPIPMPSQLELFGSMLIASAQTNTPKPSSRRGPVHKPQGAVYDLARFFAVINEVMFKQELAPPTMRWSRNRWRYTLGLCDVEDRVITLNCALDDARIPEVVVAGIMHHEMLHLYFGFSEGARGQRRYHTPEFRAAEKLFPGFETTERWIADHWPLRGRPAKRPRPETQSFLAYLSMMHG
ncbi:SprT-like domain-containing protein [bacterium]|nr:SprT-like domain-containing protein [bacterium]MBU1636763.1 SprT-like domain-containing protein [bacterium]